MSSEYNNTPGNAPPCAYASLSKYTSDYGMGVAPQGKVISGRYIVPTWDPISYDSLTNPAATCGGYVGINAAYGKGAAQCQTTYRTSLCSNGKN